MRNFRSAWFFCFFVWILLQGLTMAAWSQINVTTFHYDNARTGQNIQESVLTPANVNSNQFGKLFTIAVDGYVYAQPLYLANVQNISGGTHNVLYVATEHDSVFALDANSGAILWQTSFIDSANGITTVSNTDVDCGDIVPENGITGTPVIDPNSGTIYTVVRTKENGVFFQRLHALNVATGAEVFGGPVVIAAAVNGPYGTTINFDPLIQNSRPGLLLDNGHVVIAWASSCDLGPYHGWVMSYNAATLAQEAVLNTSPNGIKSGIWMSGDGIAADDNGNYYFATGNGTYDGTALNDYGDSIVQVGPASNGTLPVLDSFTPWDQGSLSAEDSDVGSGGVMLLPDLPAGLAYTHPLVEMGKEGTIFLLDRDNMGGYCSTCVDVDTQIVQEINNASDGVWGSPAYWNGNVYWSSDSWEYPSNLEAFSFNANNSGLLSTTPTSESAATFTLGTGTPIVSANGTSNGIVWLLDNSSYTKSCCQVLYAYDATNLGNLLYSSNQAAGNRDVPGGAVKFTSPVVANGMVYVASQLQVSAYAPITATTTVLSSNVNPGYVTQTITYTATVTAQNATPTGTVTFYQGSTVLSTQPLSNGQATYATSYSGKNAYKVSATYAPTPGTNYGGSISQVLKEVIDALPATSATALSLSSTSIYIGQPVTMTATVSSGFGTPPDGELVTFKSGGVAVGTGTLSGGVATFTTSTLSANSHTLLAYYGGDGNFKSSNSPKIVLVVSKYPTTAVLTSDLSYSNYGEPVTLTANLSTAGPSPTGKVNFLNGSASLGDIVMANGMATLTTAKIPVGLNALTASYTGDANNASSVSASIPQNVSPAVITITLTSAPNPSIAGKSVKFTATLTSNGSLPVGSAITFSYNGSTLGTANVNSTGIANFSTNALPQGGDEVTATYAGSNDYNGSTAVVTQVVNP
jgi:Bacterial Ig-like domain (group 3)